jgi:hypothetical protein
MHKLYNLASNYWPNSSILIASKFGAMELILIYFHLIYLDVILFHSARICFIILAA